MKACNIPPYYCLIYFPLHPGLNSILKIHESAIGDVWIAEWQQKGVVVEVEIVHYSSREADMPEALAVDDNLFVFERGEKEMQSYNWFLIVVGELFEQWQENELQNDYVEWKALE